MFYTDNPDPADYYQENEFNYDTNITTMAQEESAFS